LNICREFSATPSNRLVPMLHQRMHKASDRCSHAPVRHAGLCHSAERRRPVLYAPRRSASVLAGTSRQATSRARATESRAVPAGRKQKCKSRRWCSRCDGEMKFRQATSRARGQAGVGRDNITQ
jgi:hypothetical protein